jgi:hypothetical protein
MSYWPEASHGQRTTFKWRSKHSPFPDKPAYLLAFKAKMFHVKRRLVQENETRNKLSRDDASVHLVGSAKGVTLRAMDVGPLGLGR